MTQDSLKQATLTLITITAVIILTATSLIAHTTGRNDQLSAMRHTYTVCHAQPTSTDCAKSQSATSTEYLCNATYNTCWVEVK